MNPRSFLNTVIIMILTMSVLFLSAGVASGAEDAVDAGVAAYRQCANEDGDGFNGNPGECDWASGALGQNDSYYAEGESVPELLYIDGLTPGKAVWIDMIYQTTKGGIHTFDFLTNYNWSERWITGQDRCFGVLGCVDSPDSTYVIPANPAIEPPMPAPDPRVFTLRGGTLTGVTMPTISVGTFPTGDTRAKLRVSFTVASEPSPMCSAGQCKVLMWWGAHVSTSMDWGSGMGSGSISGNSFHMILDAWSEGGLGQMDNQMSSAVVTQVPNGYLTIVKKADLPASQAFTFNLNNSFTINHNFSLTDPSDVTDASITYEAPPGAWTLAELDIPDGWSLANLACTDPTGNTNTSLSAASAAIDLASGETVSCVYTNSNRPTGVTFSQEPEAASGDGFVRISWMADPLANLKGMSVYRSDTADGASKTLLADGLLFSDEYVDSSVKRGKTYFYWVEYVDGSGLNSVGPLEAALYWYLRLPIVRR